MKTTIQALGLILFAILLHLTIISTYGLMAWACVAVCCASVFVWLCEGASYETD
jgi:hypothetical protein